MQDFYFAIVYHKEDIFYCRIEKSVVCGDDTEIQQLIKGAENGRRDASHHVVCKGISQIKSTVTVVCFIMSDVALI